MSTDFSRTERLLGKDAMNTLQKARVAVFGVGGVGGFVCEALVRSGVGSIDLIDSDVVSASNLNRQIIALRSTVGRPKVDVMRERLLDINPNAAVRTYQAFVLPENVGRFPFGDYDYIVDAVDTVAAKLALIEEAHRAGVPIISSMGAGNKLDPTRFTVTDLFKTTTDPLARVLRRELKQRGVTKLKVVWSDEPPLTPLGTDDGETKNGRPAPGSVAFVPSVAGLILAGEVVKDLAKQSEA